MLTSVWREAGPLLTPHDRCASRLWTRMIVTIAITSAVLEHRHPARARVVERYCSEVQSVPWFFLNYKMIQHNLAQEKPYSLGRFLDIYTWWLVSMCGPSDPTRLIDHHCLACSTIEEVVRPSPCGLTGSLACIIDVFKSHCYLMF